MNSMRLDLWKEEKEIKVEALLSFKGNVNGAFSFQLGSNYKIHEIVDSDGRLLEYKKSGHISGQVPYWADCTKYIIKEVKSNQIRIHYTGISNAQHTMITENILSINGSSCWYPFRMEGQQKKWDREVFIHVSDDHNVLNARFIVNQSVWHYQPQEGELFIIALKNYRYKMSDAGIIYYYFKEDDKKAEICVNTVSNLLSYFERLFGYKTTDKIPIVSLPTDFNAGAYNIDSTIILNRFVFDYEDNISTTYERFFHSVGLDVKLIHLMGHEIAHNWCCGADSNWEDWLNETTAEWSSLAFLIEEGYSEYVEKVIKYYYENEKLEPIRTKDGNRPQQVHIKGTLLFYNFYKKYGLDIVKDFLRAFVKLKDKNTENWINQLNEKYINIVPDVIKGLDIKLFKSSDTYNKV